MKKIIFILIFNSFYLLSVAQFSLVWEQHYNGIGDFSDRFKDMTTDNQGNIYATGYTFNRSAQRDLLVAKFDPTGNLIWSYSYGNPNGTNDEGESIILDNANNILVTGDADRDFITIKLDNNGALQWAKTYEGPEADGDFAYKIAAGSDNAVYLTGRSEQTAGDYEITTIKYNTSGAEQWVRTWSNAQIGYDIPYDLVLDIYDNVYVRPSCSDK